MGNNPSGLLDLFNVHISVLSGALWLLTYHFFCVHHFLDGHNREQSLGRLEG